MGDTTYEFVAVLESADRDALVTYLSHPVHAELELSSGDVRKDCRL
jgi:hypothetical protein